MRAPAIHATLFFSFAFCVQCVRYSHFPLSAGSPAADAHFFPSAAYHIALARTHTTQLFGMEAEPSFDAAPLLASDNSPGISPSDPAVTLAELKQGFTLATSPHDDNDAGWDDDDLDNLFE